MSQGQALTQVNETDVENFFKNVAEFTANPAGANRAQRRRVADCASSFWRNLSAGNTLAPSGSSTSGGLSGLGGSTGSLGTPVSSGGPATSFRAAKEQGAVLSLTTNAQTGLLLRPRALAQTASVEVGKTTLSETERWKLQAALRREETKASGEKYNQNMLRETKTAKPPTPGEAFPAGRGKPVRN